MNTLEEWRRDRYQHHAVSPGWPALSHSLPSDIVLHLPVIEWFASQCLHCTEFGVREAHSSVALLCGCLGKVASYDVLETEAARRLKAVAGERWELHLRSTVDPDLVIEETDLLLLDTLHTYAHLAKELAQHAGRVRRFFVFHDTETCGEADLSGPDPQERGILPAIREFIEREGHAFRLAYKTAANNGLIVLERTTGGARP